MSTSKIFAVLCETEGRRQEIAAHLAAPDVDVRDCPTSDSLHQLTTTVRVDVVIIEQQLPGFLSGLDILTRLASDLVRPVSVVVGNLAPEDQNRAAALRVSAVLPREASAETIADAARSALSTAIHTGLQIPHAARTLVRDASFIRPLPQLIVRVAGLLDDPQASVKMLTRELSTDARITAELFKVLNSASTGLTHRVTRVQDAIAFLGMKRTVALVVSTYLMGTGTRMTNPLPDGMEQRLRLRTVLTAAAAQTYANLCGLTSPDMAYVLALMQDLGMLVMAHELGPRYHQILQRCWTVPQLQLAGYEQHELGFSHADVSAALLQKWELAPLLIQLVWQHHGHGADSTNSPTEQGWLEAMQVAEALADLRDQTTPQRRVHLQRLLDQRGHGGEAFFRNFLTQSLAHAQDLAQIFNMPTPDDSALRRILGQLAAESDVELPEPDPIAAEAAFLPDPEAPVVEIAEPAAAAPTTPATPPQPRGLSRKELDRPVLFVIDDDPAILRYVTRLLTGTRYEVRCFTDPHQALEQVQSAALFLVDWHLPMMTAHKFIHRLREAGVDAPVLVVSGDRSRQTVLDSIQVGVCDYIPKPFDRGTLLSKLRQHLLEAAERAEILACH
jgi:HD-like signal output (HDOD) protein/DNA-binding response OmpR family regulator